MRRFVGGKTAAADGAAAMCDARHRMQMAADFGRRAARQMAETQAADLQGFDESAADIAGRLRIVIAGEPDPVTAALQPPQIIAVLITETRRSAAVVKTVAERDHAVRRVMRDEAGKPRQRRRGVVRRQQLAARRVTRAFFQMEIRNGKEPLFGPIDRAGGIGEQRNAGKDNEIAHAVRRIFRRQAHFIASFTSSSAASANRKSAASP